MPEGGRPCFVPVVDEQETHASESAYWPCPGKGAKHVDRWQISRSADLRVGVGRSLRLSPGGTRLASASRGNPMAQECRNGVGAVPVDLRETYRR
jgi:hypothetical protein